MGFDYDVVVAGGGIGGLFATAKLTKEGKRVLLLEQHSIVGGYTSFFKRNCYTFDTSLHALDGLRDKNCETNQIFSEFGFDGKLKLLRLPEFYTILSKTTNITLKDDIDEAEKDLIKLFPKEKRGIQKFTNILRGLHKEVATLPKTKFGLLVKAPLVPFQYPNIIKTIKKSLGQLLDHLFEDERLKLLLSANTGYFHDDPFEYSAVHYGAAQGSYLIGGGFYVKGGSQKIVDLISEYIIKNGGVIETSATVSGTLFTKNRVSGVTYTNKSGEGKEVSARSIIVNMPIPNFIKILPEKYYKKLDKKYGSYKLSHSIFNLYIGLKKPLKEIGDLGYTTFIVSDKLTTLEDMHKYNKTTDFLKKIIAVVDYSYILEDSEPTISVTVIDKSENWENLTDEEYRRKKEVSSQNLIDQIEKYMPGFRENIKYYEAATPRTFERYTKNPKGVIYGYAQSANQIGFNRPDNYSGIKGIYFASAWSKPGGGITPSAKSGYRAALETLKRDF